MQIQTFTLGELQTNCYLVIDQNTQQCLIIDPADDANFISEQILRQNLKPVAILATHGHFDHILAAGELQMAFNTPFYINEKDLFLVKNLQKNASFWTKREIIERPPSPTFFSSDNFKFSILNFKLDLIPTPGHTPGSVCFYFPKEKPACRQARILFSGDTLFKDGVGRTDLSYSSPSDLQNSLKKLAPLPRETKICPGHGESFLNKL